MHAASACLTAGDWLLSLGSFGVGIAPLLGKIGSGQFGAP